MKPPNHRPSASISTCLLLLGLAALPSLSSASQLPFLPAATSHPQPIPALARRQDNSGCLANFYSCAATQGAAFQGICCANGQVCGLDAANQPACCPAGAVCTGTAPQSFSPPSTATISYVPNAYFSFPYAPTSFPNGGACSSAVGACSNNYAACTSRLAGVGGGGAGGVTVVAGGSTVVGGQGGVTTTLPAESASSVCSSLSSQACGGLQNGWCNNAGVTTGGFVIGTGSGNAAAARQTGAVGMGMGMGVVIVGVGMGVINGL
ncbi:hypothetical protein GE09DRAFT_170636 [Coniochaeta sp. 2T2.1]|nr:hypothetical protein GE09DRAFT_170636 [Coniochaeta sp. 2T2.1]